MSTHQSKVQIPGTLRREIRVAAEQVAERRQALKFRRAALGERLHASLSSPDMLLFAVGTGFAIGEFTGRARPARDSKNERKSRKRPLARAEAALRFAFKVFTLTHAATAAMAGPPEIQDVQ